MKYLKILIISLLLSSCATSHTQVNAKVEDVIFKGNKNIIVTNRGTFICGECPTFILAQKYYKFELDGKTIKKMELME